MITEIKVVIDKPPVWDNIIAAFGFVPHTAIFTYGDTIYNPNNYELRDDVIEHEKVHMAQQDFSATGAALWWGRFLREPLFRIDQEAKAYGRQYQYVCEKGTTRLHRRYVLKQLAKILSGKLYNNSISFEVAKQRIKLYAHQDEE